MGPRSHQESVGFLAVCSLESDLATFGGQVKNKYVG